MQLGRCCKCNQNPVMSPVLRHLRAVGPLPPELGTENGFYNWGVFNPRTGTSWLSEYKNRTGYYLALPPGFPLSTDYYSTILAQPFRYEIHDWSEGFYGFSQRRDAPYDTYTGATPKRYPYDTARDIGTPGDFDPYHTAPPTKKIVLSKTTHLSRLSCNFIEWKRSYAYGFDAQIGFPTLGDVVLNVAGRWVSVYRVLNATTHGRVLIDGVDVTGVVPVVSDSNYDKVPLNVDLSSVLDKPLTLDLWHAAAVKRYAGSPEGVVDQIGYIGSWPGENVVMTARYSASSPFQNCNVSVSGGLVGGRSTVVVGAYPQQPEWLYDSSTLGVELFGTPNFSWIISNLGEGFAFISKEVPVVAVFKPKPGNPAGNVKKRVVWYAPQNSGDYANLVLPNGRPHTLGAWNQQSPTVFLPYAQGFKHRYGAWNYIPEEWRDFADSGDTPPLWTPGDSIYSDFPTSITVSPP